MLNIEKARLILKEYIQPYDMNNPRIAMKAEHIFRVADVSKRIAQELELTEEQIKLAELIGLLHDIGRFEQLRIYDTFSDIKSVDHAELGIQILKENNLLMKFCEDKKYHKIIIKAIHNHNKFKIDEDAKGEILLQSKIIRDADKVDIFNILTTENFDTIYKKENITDEKITKEVLQTFLERKQVDRTKLKNNIDLWLNDISFIFDIYFKPSFKIIKENDYINTMIDRTKTEEMEKVRQIANTYINEKCEE